MFSDTGRCMHAQVQTQVQVHVQVLLAFQFGSIHIPSVLFASVSYNSFAAVNRNSNSSLKLRSMVDCLGLVLLLILLQILELCNFSLFQSSERNDFFGTLTITRVSYDCMAYFLEAYWFGLSLCIHRFSMTLDLLKIFTLFRKMTSRTLHDSSSGILCHMFDSSILDQDDKLSGPSGRLSEYVNA